MVLFSSGDTRATDILKLVNAETDCWDKPAHVSLSDLSRSARTERGACRGMKLEVEFEAI